MKRTVQVFLIVLCFALGAASTLLAAPSKTKLVPCNNIGCYFIPPNDLYCGFQSGWNCGMNNPDECHMSPCGPT